MMGRRFNHTIPLLIGAAILAVVASGTIMIAPVVTNADGSSQTYSTPGTYSFVVPNFGTLTVEMVGGGGGGGAGYYTGGVTSGGAGGASSFGNYLTAGGGGGGVALNSWSASTPGGAAGGANATAGGYANNNNVTSGGGGISLWGTGGPGLSWSGSLQQGNPAAGFGGGGGGGTGLTGGGGGGGGGYSTGSWTAPQIPAGSSVSVTVGAGGSGGTSNAVNSGGAGTPGKVIIIWTAASSCTTPWSTTINSGNTVQAWQSSSVPYGNSCVSETRTCTNGSLSGSYTNQNCTVQSAGTPLTGYAWSDTTGWISFAGTGYGVTIASDKTLSGYAWSDNIGWIKFGGLSSFPSGSGTTAANASLTGNALTGWIRACAGTQAGDCSSMTSRTDGWDGWIALSGSTYGPTLAGGAFTGYAWGSDVVGWVDFSPVITTFQACQDTQGYQCVSGNSVHTDAACTQTTDVCPSHGSGWFCATDTHLCNAPAPPSSNLTDSQGHPQVLRVRPQLVHPGQTATVNWDVSNADSCVVTEDNASITDTWSGVPTGTHTTSPIRQTTTYSITCSGGGGVINGSATVTVVPTWREL